MKELGYGADYKYSHNYPGHFVAQQFLPDGLTGHRFWTPADNPAEKKLDDLQRSRWQR